MDLPRRSFPFSRLNCLDGAVHPQFGLAWTDGESVFLVDVAGRVPSTRKIWPSMETDSLPDDETIQALRWNASSKSNEALLGLVTRKSAVILRVSTSSSSSSSDLSSPICRGVKTVPCAPLISGVLWNPSLCHVLCLLTKDNCLLFTRLGENIFGSASRESAPNTGTDTEQYQFPVSRAYCGTWTPDGLTLLLGVKSTILIWSWSDEGALTKGGDLLAVQRSVPCSDNVSREILSLASISKDRVLLTTSVSNFFPTNANVSDGNQSTISDDGNVEDGNENLSDTNGNDDEANDTRNGDKATISDGDKANNNTGNNGDQANDIGSNDDEVNRTSSNVDEATGNAEGTITLRRRPTVLHHLFDIHGRNNSSTLDNASLATLGLLVKEGDDWKCIAEKSLLGILSPDLVAFESISGQDSDVDADAEIMVGSIAADQLLRFRFRRTSLELVEQVRLPRGCRARGLVSSKYFLNGQAPQPFVVAIAYSSSHSSSSSSSLCSSSLSSPSSFPSPPSSPSFDHAFVPRNVDAALPVSLHFLRFSKSSENQIRQERQHPLQQQQKPSQQLQRDDETLKSLMRDCVIALRAADPKKVQDGSCLGMEKTTTKTKTTDCGTALGVCGGGGGVDTIVDGGEQKFSSMLNDISDLFAGIRDYNGDGVLVEEVVDGRLRVREKVVGGATEGGNQPDERTEDSRIDEAKSSLRNTLDSGTKGPIDVMGLLAEGPGREGRGWYAAGAAAAAGLARDCGATAPIDVTASPNDRADRKTGITEEVFEAGEGDEAFDAWKLSKLEERLEAIESKLTRRLKERRAKSSMAGSMRLLEMRIERIEKLVEMICSD